MLLHQSYHMNPVYCRYQKNIYAALYPLSVVVDANAVCIYTYFFL